MVSALFTANSNTLFHGLGPLTARCKIEEHGRRNMLLVNIRPRETIKPFVEYSQSKMLGINPHVSISEDQDTSTPTFSYDPLGDIGEQLARLKDLYDQGHITNEEMFTIMDEMEHRR